MTKDYFPSREMLEFCNIIEFDDDSIFQDHLSRISLFSSHALFSFVQVSKPTRTIIEPRAVIIMDLTVTIV